MTLKVSAMSRSFQIEKNSSSATVKTPLRTSGRPTLKNARNGPPPSRASASNSSRGTARKYVAIRNTVSGRPCPT